MPTNLEADYLIVGSGAMGMAFADTLATETRKTMLIVDERDRPGGHWNDAYPFVRLHQPSAFYGVNSLRLGTDAIDTTGGNAGLYELACGAEVVCYFDRVMQRQLLPTGRVRYFPSCRYEGAGRFSSLVSGATFTASAGRVVDATYMNVSVPSTREPPFAVAQGIRCVPPNALARLREPWAHYVVIGGGKTGMDACLWLLERGVEPRRISWVVPRDSWLLDRAQIQPGRIGGHRALAALADQMEAIAGAESIDHLFERVSACGALLRLDPEVWPTMYRCATVTRAELEALRRIPDRIRLGHVTRIDADRTVFSRGERSFPERTLFVDCAADGLAWRPVVPVFDGRAITLQPVRVCQQVFSAAFIAHIEATRESDEEKNALCAVVPHPDSAVDYLRATLANGANQLRWGQQADLLAWLSSARLDAVTAMLSGAPGDAGGEAIRGTDPDGGRNVAAEREALQKKLATFMLPAAARLSQLLESLDERPRPGGAPG